MKRICLVSAAEEEMVDAARYYEEQMRGLGADFYTRLEVGFSHISECPDCWPIIRDDVRRYLISRFPYSLLYRVERDEIVVLAVMHQSRHPHYWQGRC